MALNFSHTVRINAPPDRVFAVATDVDSFARWMPNFVRAERLTDGDIGVGSQFTETRKMYGRDSTEHFEYTAFDPDKGFTLFVDGTKGTTGKGEFIFVHRLDAVDEGAATDLTLDGEIGGLGKIMEFFARLFMGSMTKAIAADFASLKAYIEAAPDDADAAGGDGADGGSHPSQPEPDADAAGGDGADGGSHPSQPEVQPEIEPGDTDVDAEEGGEEQGES
jgi:carbon monoxide dehydrogenase subunit G